ncbi:MAG TPA: hypothetical protein VFQ41_14415 [Candidatus Angelobacter sp.]|nr:hypothetical protein [Candidatus Angelobacter sp.]
MPSAQRPAGDPLAPSVIAGAQVVEGVVKSVHCSRGADNEEQGYTVVIDQGGHDLTFQAKSGFGVGYSDTLWWGRDHFSSCLHIEGLRAVVHYKPSSDAKYAGELARLDLRDDLPQQQPKTAEDKTAEKTSMSK